MGNLSTAHSIKCTQLAPNWQYEKGISVQGVYTRRPVHNSWVILSTSHCFAAENKGNKGKATFILRDVTHTCTAPPRQTYKHHSCEHTHTQSTQAHTYTHNPLKHTHTTHNPLKHTHTQNPLKHTHTTHNPLKHTHTHTHTPPAIPG